MYNSIDTYFTFSQNNSAISFRVLDSLGSALEFNQRRLAIEEILKSWGQSASTLTEDNAAERLNSLENDLSVIARFIDDLAALVPRQSISDKYTDEQRIEDTARIAAARANVTESQRKIDGARTAIVNSSGSNAAISNAQVKQALGALESARASLGKTIIKTPVAGTVTAVSISIGDIINVGSDVVFVAGDTAATETTATVPLTAVKFTPTKAYIFTVEAGVLVAHEVKTGLVTNTSIAISGAEAISEVVADIRGLKEGDVVVIN
jgi:biotin carboxyl carrier protein